MKNLFLVLAVMAATVTVAFGGQSAAQIVGSGAYGAGTDTSVTLKGYLIDERCALARLSKIEQTALAHPTECLMKSGEGGLGMVYKGQWVPFDEKGSKKAADMLKKADAARGLMVSATGSVKRDRFVVSRIKEIKSL